MKKVDEVVIDGENLLVIKALKKMGFKTTKPRHKNANGSDLFAIKDNYVLSVEVKKATKIKNVFRTRRVTRTHDDLIAIVFPFDYVLIEPMRDHLKCCNKGGDRFLNY
jgi:Holliday junction resolvase-like predicted endonuclease